MKKVSHFELSFALHHPLEVTSQLARTQILLAADSGCLGLNEMLWPSEPSLASCGAGRGDFLSALLLLGARASRERGRASKDI